MIPQRPKMKTWRGDRLRYVHGKLDGIMLTLVMFDDESLRAFTRHHDPSRGDVTDKVRGSEWFTNAERLLAPNESLMGELYLPGRRASDVKSHWDHANFAAFAMPSVREDYPIEDLNSFLSEHGISTIPWWRFDDFDEAMFDTPRSVHPDFEGFVLKDGNMLNWQKYKAERTIDLIVARIKQGNGQFAMMAGSLVMRTSEGYEVGSAGGMDTVTRRKITKNDIGRVAEIQYQYVGSKGRLRHPRFVRWRDDKRPDECTVDQDPELQEYWSQ